MAPRSGSNLHPQVALVAGSDSTGRARITFPQFNVAGAVARVCKHVGPLSTDDEVLVVFMNGDPNYPIVVGRF
jgi:hypothetical protein